VQEGEPKSFDIVGVNFVDDLRDLNRHGDIRVFMHHLFFDNSVKSPRHKGNGV